MNPTATMNEPKYDTNDALVAETNKSPAPEKSDQSDSDVADQKLFDALEEPQHIRRIVREAILLAGGAVAILLQVAEPGVGKGVDNHSNFDYRPMDRLRTTMTYVYCMAFGSREEKITVTEMVHRAHAPVRGDGYSADDPELQLWVAATLYAVGTDVYERVFGPLTQEAAEETYREYAVLAVSLRVQSGMASQQKGFLGVLGQQDRQSGDHRQCEECCQGPPLQQEIAALHPHTHPPRAH